MNKSKLDRHHDDHAEPDRIEPELLDDRKDNGDREDHHGKRIHQATQHDVHEHDQCQHPIAAEPQPDEKGRDLLRGLRDGKKIAEQQRADQNSEYGSRGARCLQQRPANVHPFQSAAQNPDQKRASGPHAARFRRREQAAIKPANHKEKQQKRRPDIAQPLHALGPGGARACGQIFRPRPDDHRDRHHVHGGGEDARKNSRDEELADVLLGNDSVDRENR